MFDDARFETIVQHQLVTGLLDRTCVARPVLRELLRCCFEASLLVDESRAPRVRVVLDRPDETQWSSYNHVRFEPKELYAGELAKIAQAVEPRQCSLLVDHDVNLGLRAWGIAMTEMSLWRRHAGLSMKAQHEGRSHVSVEILDPGLLQLGEDDNPFVSIGIRGDEIIRTPTHFAQLVHNEPWRGGFFGTWGSVEIGQWQRTVNLLLLSIWQQKHGGALLIQPDGQDAVSTHIAVKYAAPDPARSTSLLQKAADDLRKAENDYDMVLAQAAQLAGAPGCIDLLHVMRAVAESKQDRYWEACQGVSYLAAVDGAILLSKDLRVLGFGAIVKNVDDMNAHQFKQSPDFGASNLEDVGRSARGTRHRAAAAFCGQHPGAAAFVVSQDGHIRAMMSHNQTVIVWEISLRPMG